MIYRFLHQEECRLGVDPWNPFPGPDKDSFDGDAAVPWDVWPGRGAPARAAGASWALCLRLAWSGFGDAFAHGLLQPLG